jgi:hypothetical protein
MDPRTKLFKHRAALVREFLNRLDPAQLIAIGAPADEYDAETPQVIRAMTEARDEADLRVCVAQVFRSMFGDSFGVERCDELSSELWRLSHNPLWENPTTNPSG